MTKYSFFRPISRALIWFHLATVLGGMATAQQPQAIKFTSFGGELGFQWEAVSERTTRGDLETNAYSESFFGASLALRTSGFAYHPNLLEFSIQAELVQNRSQIENLNQDYLYKAPENTYDIKITLLKKKPVRTQIYFSRTVLSAGRAFLGRFYGTTENRGIRLNAGLGIVRMELDIFQLNKEYETISLSSNRIEQTENISFYSRVVGIEGHNAGIAFTYREYSELEQDTSYETNQLFAHWTIELDKIRNSKVRNTFQFRNILNAFTQSNLLLTSSYSTDLKWRFKLLAELEGKVHEFDDVRSNVFQGRLSLAHQLYESLSSLANLEFRKEDVEGSSRSILSQHMNVAYRKKIPTGSIAINLAQRIEKQSFNSDEQASRDVIVASFSEGDALVITRVGLNPSTLVVTSADLSALYVLGVDYDVLYSGQSIVLLRIQGGNIEPGSTVQISFLAETYPDYEMDLHSHSERIQVRFLKILRIGWENRITRNDLRSDFNVAPLEEYDVTKHMAGLDSKYLSVSGYKEDYVGTFSEYEATNFQATVRYSFLSRYRLAYTISRNDIEFLTSDHFSRFDNRYASLSWHTVAGFSGDVGYLEMEYETPTYLRRRKSIRAKAQWPIRKLLLTGFYEYILEDSDLSKRRHSYYIFSIKRRF